MLQVDVLLPAIHLKHSDGAAFVIVMGEKMMNELGLKPIGRLVSCASAGVHPRIMGIGPVAAIPKALKQAGMNLIAD